MFLPPNRHSVIGKSPPAPSRLAQLAGMVQDEVAAIEGHIEAQGLPALSLDVGAPMEIPSSLAEHQQSLLGALDELHALVAGPLGLLMRTVSPVHNIQFAVQILHRYRVPQKVPLPSDLSSNSHPSNAYLTSKNSITFAALAKSTSLPKQVLTRTLRVLIAHRIFTEPSPGILSHNGVSQLFLTVPGLDQWLGFFVDEVAPAAAHAADALQIWPHSSEPFETGWNLAAAASGRPVVGQSVMQHLRRNPAAMRRFEDGFGFLRGSPAYSPHHLAENLGWDGRGCCPGTVVDVGGASGSVAVHLLRRFPGIRRYVVQDLPEVLQQVQVSAPPDLQGRLVFQPTDLFAGPTNNGIDTFLPTTQPNQPQQTYHQNHPNDNHHLPTRQNQLHPNADIYLLRTVLHNWSDAHAALALRRIASVMHAKSRIVINEICLPQPGVLSHYQDQLLRGCDLSMLHILNARERDGPDWSALVAMADPRLEVLSVVQAEGALLAVIVVGFGR